MCGIYFIPPSHTRRQTQVQVLSPSAVKFITAYSGLTELHSSTLLFSARTLLYIPALYSPEALKYLECRAIYVVSRTLLRSLFLFCL